MTLEDLKQALQASYRRDTAYKQLWNEAKPETGHCAVAALVVQDYFGGEILKCSISPGGGTHYWNKLDDGTEVDVTAGQFDTAPSRREVTRVYRASLLRGDTKERYLTFATRVGLALPCKQTSAPGIQRADNVRGEIVRRIYEALYAYSQGLCAAGQNEPLIYQGDDSNPQFYCIVVEHGGDSIQIMIGD